MPPPTFYVEKILAKEHRKWLHDTKIVVHLPNFCLKNNFFRTHELQHTKGIIY